MILGCVRKELRSVAGGRDGVLDGKKRCCFVAKVCFIASESTQCLMNTCTSTVSSVFIKKSR